MSSPIDLKQAYKRDGFVLVPNLVSDDQLSELRAACARVVKKTRRGEWPHRRVVGKQFPPFGKANPDSWGVQHVMHPALEEPLFVKWYTSDAVVDVVKQLLECDEDDLEMGEHSTLKKLVQLADGTNSQSCSIS